MIEIQTHRLCDMNLSYHCCHKLHVIEDEVISHLVIMINNNESDDTRESCSMQKNDYNKINILTNNI